MRMGRSTWAFDPNANNVVSSVVVQGDGKVLLGGFFSSLQPNGAGAPTARNFVARVNADGTLDTGFDPSVDGYVYSMAVQADGKVLLAGSFGSLQPNGAASPTTRTNVARLNTDGTLDTGFDPSANDLVSSVAVQADGKVLLGGDFSSLQPNGAASPTTRRCLARVDTDGALDEGFDPNANNSVLSMAVQADGKVLLGGRFTSLQPNGAGSPTTRNYVARVNTDGTLDTGFYAGANSSVYGVAVQADGKVLLGGSFTGFGAAGGIPRATFARLNNDPATQTLTASNATQVLWTRGGTGPELEQVTFDKSTDGGTTWTALGAGTRVGTSANWTRTGLSLPGSGHVRARGRASGGSFNTSSGLIEQITAFTLGPVVTTPTSTSVTSTSATLGGNVTSDAGSAITERGVVYALTSANADPQIGGTGVTKVTATGTTGVFTAAVSGLSASSAYSFKAYATNANGTGYTSVDAFTTPAPPPGPTVTMPTSASVTSTGATLGGNVTSDAGSAITERGVVYALTSANADPLIGGTGVTKVTATGTTGVFTAAVTGLTLSSGYSFKAYATNANGTGYTSVATFTTLAAPAPEIAVEHSAGTNLVDGTGTVDFGSVTRGSNGVKTFTIKNTGNASLTVGVISKDGTNSADYIVQTTGLSASVAGGSSTTFTVTFAPTGDGTRTAAIHIANNDGNEAPFDIGLTGTGAAPTSATSTPTAQAGGPAPGAGGAVLIPSERAAPPAMAPAADATLTSVGVPAINEAGDVVAFLGKWTQATGKGSGLFTETECLAAIGAAVTPITGATYKKLSDPVVGGDTVAFIAMLGGVPKAEATAVFLRQPQTAPTVLAQTGKPAPDAGGGTFKKIKGIAASQGNAAVFAQTSDGKNGIWVTAANGDLKRVLSEGQTLPGNKTIKKLVTFKVGKTSPGQGRGWLATDGAGAASALALATFSDRTTALLSADIAGVTVLSASGTDFASYGVPAGNGDGDSVFAGSRVIGGAVTKANAKGIFADTGAGFVDVARVGGQAGANGETFSVLSDPVLGADGGVAFLATLKGGNAKGLAAKTLWWQPAGQPLELLAQGGTRPGADLPAEAQWKAFSSLAIASGRGPIFAATLVPGKGGVTKATASGVWATDAAGNPRLLFRTGDMIGGKTLKKFTLLNATVGSVGVTRSFNDNGRVVWQATFTDKTTAIITTEVP